jgi:hypothetical protein
MNHLLLKDSAPCPHSKVHLSSMFADRQNGDLRNVIFSGL